MKQLLVEVEFIFEGEGWSEFTRSLAERVWDKICAEWVDIFNAHISEFNDEFDIEYPEVDCSEEDSEGRNIYDNFVSEQMKPYNDDFNKTKLNGSIFMADCDPMFMLRLREYPGSYMKLRWTTVKCIGRDYKV